MIGAARAVARAPSPANGESACLPLVVHHGRFRRGQHPSMGSCSWEDVFEELFWLAQPFSAAFRLFPRKRAFVPAGLASLLLLTACGYHTAGHAVTLPTNISTIAIPTFVNNTETYKIEQRLTAAVVANSLRARIITS